MTDAVHGPFLTRAAARERGITPGQLRGPGFRRLFTDVYVPAGTPVTDRLRARAALTLAPNGAVIARHTAAALLGGVVPGTPDTHLTLPTGRMRVAGIDARRGTVGARATFGGIPVTSAEETFAGLSRDLGLVDLVVLGDSLVKAARCTPASLVSAAKSCGRRPGNVLVRAASLVREGVDSPMESRLRMLLVLAGLPEPVVNFIEYDEVGHWKRRFDLSYPQHQLAIEYDGRQHAQTQQQWERDVDRREALDVDDWTLVVVLAKGIYREPARTVQRVVAAMTRVGMPARVRSDEWRLYFPGI
jgi:very-short-patch-repair endonuclease